MQEEKNIRKCEFLLKEAEKDINTDKALLFYEIISSKAHVITLEKSGILSKEEASKLVFSLNKLLNACESNKIQTEGSEDIHFFIENFLIKDLGYNLGGKLHIGRSRNELIINDIRLYLRDWINNFSLKILSGVKKLIEVSEKNLETIFPSYTHLQQAVPISFGYYLLAHVEFFLRVYERLREIYERVNICVLGSGAIAGLNWSINRRFLSKLLGFKKVSSNAFDSINSRGEIEAEILFVLSLLSNHLSRICEDLIIYSSQEFNLVDIPEECTGISSIMPQKRNPDALELVRGKCSKIISSMFEVFNVTKSLPSGYNKDLQVIKDTLFNSLETTEEIFEEIIKILCNLRIKEESFLESKNSLYTVATDVADYLVMKFGLSFRQSHSLVSEAVKTSLKSGKDYLSILQEYLTKEYGNVVLNKFRNIKKSVYRKRTYGSTNPLNVKTIIKLKKRIILKEESKVLREAERLKTKLNYLKSFSY